MIGKAVRRKEDPRFLAGRGAYVEDLRLPGMRYARFIRSPHAHARITAIRTEAAARIADVFTLKDVSPPLGPLRCPESLDDQRSPVHSLLAGDRVYTVGHAVAVVVADSAAAARDAVDLVEVDYDPLPVVADPVKALQPDSPETHPGLGGNRAYHWTLKRGDADARFAAADRILHVRMNHPRLIPMAMETRGCVASFDAGTGDLTLWTSTQIPHLVKILLAEALGMPEPRIRVVAPDVGGGFGAKLNLYPEEILISHLAKVLGAPVQWIESRRENASTTIHGRDQHGEYEVALQDDGKILAVRSRTVADLGAYLQMGTPAIPTLTGLMLPGCYAMKAVDIAVTGVHTHKMATDAYRGAGRPEACYTIERLADLCAAELEMDRVEFRKRNFPKASQFPWKSAAGVTYDSGDYLKSLKEAQRLADWDRLIARRDAVRKEGRLSGVGLSTYVEICSFGPSKGMTFGGWEWGCVRIERDGRVVVITGSSPHGQGQETSFAQIAADRLGIPLHDISVLKGDTAVAPHGRDTYGSRATAIGGTAILRCAEKLAAKARLLAGHLLGCAPARVAFKDGVFSAKGKRLDWKRLADEAYAAKQLPPGFEPGLEASTFFEPPGCTFPFGCHIVAVDVDRDTGEVAIRNYVAVDDCGNRVNPLLVEGQIQGGIAHSIGQALTERTVYGEDGQLLTGEFTDYAIPRAEDIPEYILGATVTPSPNNPLGVKGVGEAGTIGSAPALVNAVVDALAPLGVRHLDMPMTPERVWRAIHEPATRPAVMVEVRERRR
jgi:carbon-monoxide dehydrogenase large subunit